MPEIIVVMGVTGVGKSTVGQRLAAALREPFIDADDFHEDDAKARMAAGIPLTEAEREPWLSRLNTVLRAHVPTGAVLACSALTEHARAVLTEGLPTVRFVLLTGDPGLIRARVEHRHDHFAGAALLPSQFATLEPPAGAVTVNVDGTPDETAARALAALAQDDRSTSI